MKNYTVFCFLVFFLTGLIASDDIDNKKVIGKLQARAAKLGIQGNFGNKRSLRGDYGTREEQLEAAQSKYSTYSTDFKRLRSMSSSSSSSSSSQVPVLLEYTYHEIQLSGGVVAKVQNPTLGCKLCDESSKKYIALGRQAGACGVCLRQAKMPQNKLLAEALDFLKQSDWRQKDYSV